MNEWKIEKLKDVSLLITDGKHGDCQNQNNSGFYFISAKDIKDGYISYEDVREITEEDFHDTHRRTQFEIDDITLVSTGANIGDLAIAKDKDKTPRTTFQKSVALIKVDKNLANPIFVAYQLKNLRTELHNVSSGSAQKNLLLKDLRNFPVKLPSLYTQQKIATLLSAFDDLIENNLKRIKLLEEIAQRTYEEWFVKFRINGEQLAIDEGTGLPEGWELKEIQFFGKVVTGKTPSTLNAENFDGTVPFVKTPDMHGLPYVIKTNQTLSRLGAELQSKKFIPKNSIMVSCIGSAGVYALASTDCQTNQQINAVDFFKEYYSFYFYCFAGNLKPLLEGLGSNGATMTNVNKGKFEKINVVYPGDELLKDFHVKIKSNFELILTMQKQNEILKEARDILLPRLMDGEIDVKEMEMVGVTNK